MLLSQFLMLFLSVLICALLEWEMYISIAETKMNETVVKVMVH